MICKKCKGPATFTIRKEHYYCENCLTTNINHKFRACIGKNKILSSNDNVLVCLSGGVSSAVLLDLIFHGVSLDSTKKLRITPIFLHFTGLEKTEKEYEVAELIVKQCQSYNFNVYIVDICKFYSREYESLPTYNVVPKKSDKANGPGLVDLKNICDIISPTCSNDIVMKIKRNMYIRMAEKLNCYFIFTAETTTTLAVNLLSNLAVGRGSQVKSDIGFVDDLDENIRILRPMKDITEEELYHYIKIKELKFCCIDNKRDNSLQAVINSFVYGLQESFPATVSTICKTADKIGCIDKGKKRCQLCKSYLSNKSEKITAIQATTFSRAVSKGRPNEYLNVDTFKTQNEHDINSMFPFINNLLCYCCSKNYLETSNTNIFKIGRL